jgi:hypothetical protein
VIGDWAPVAPTGWSGLARARKSQRCAFLADSTEPQSTHQRLNFVEVVLVAALIRTPSAFIIQHPLGQREAAVAGVEFPTKKPSLPSRSRL